MVYGTRTDETLADERLVTRFDFDEVFGTALNRFCSQAVIGFPLTPFGKAGQTRGFLNIMDTMRCIELTILNPPERGKYRVFNQFTERFSVGELAQAVEKAGKEIGLKVEIKPIFNPRVESEGHYYNPDLKKLLDLGLEPRRMEDALGYMLEDLLKYKDRIEAKKDRILPIRYFVFHK